jgi:hypothetical protein
MQIAPAADIASRGLRLQPYDRVNELHLITL